MKTSCRLFALLLVALLLMSMGSPALAADYTRFSQTKTGISNDRTILLRANPDPSAQEDNVIKTLSGVRGEAFELLGESGDFYYARYDGAEGFVRKQDFDIAEASASPSPTPTPTPTPKPSYTPISSPKEGTATDSAIWMRATASADGEIVKKLSGVRGEVFELLGESGDWYYARYDGTEGFVRKQDFTLPGQTPAPASQPSGDKWGKIQVDGTKINHTIYCNAISGNDYKYNKSYYNIFSMTNYSSQLTVLMRHNMRKSAGSSTGMFHDLHHVQNAFLGVRKCESCGRSCSGAKTEIFDIDYQGYSKWQLLCFYETPSSGSYNVLVSTATNTGSPSSWLSTQYSNARNSSYKGMVVDDSGTGSDRLMVLITCGDKYGSSSTSRLYVVLKAVS